MNHNLPISWVWTRLEEISEIILGQSPPSSTYNENGTGLPFYQGKLEFGSIYPIPQKWCASPKKIAEKGDVLISVRAPVGPTNICPKESCIGRGLAAIRPLGGIETLFILYLMRKYENVISEKGTGSTFDAITGNQLRGFEIPLPPLPEQRRIVTKIEELFTKLDAGTSALQKTQAQLKRYRSSVLKAACEGKLVPTEAELAKAEGRAYEAADVLLARVLKERREKLSKGAKYKEPAAPDMSDLSALPEGWVWATYEQIGKWSGGGTPSTRNPTYWKDGTIPWISPKDMKCLKICESEDKITEIALDNSSANLIPSGSILFVVRSGILRRTLPVALTMVDATVNQDIKSLTPDTSIDSDYLLITTLAFNEDIRHSCAKDGTTVESIEVPALQVYAIPLPPLAEQRRIVAEVERRLSIADGVERTVEQSLAQAQRLRQSILKKAFEGRLVAQDPGDEPAGVLLERIKQQKQLSNQTNKTARRNANGNKSR